MYPPRSFGTACILTPMAFIEIHGYTMCLHPSIGLVQPWADLWIISHREPSTVAVKAKDSVTLDGLPLYHPDPNFTEQPSSRLGRADGREGKSSWNPLHHFSYGKYLAVDACT